MSTFLDTKWIERMSLLAKSDEHRRKAQGLDKDRFSAPKGCKITMWFSAISSYHEAQKERYEMDKLAYEADSVWHEAVTQEKGNVRVEWEETPKGYKCTLETGEVFEP